MLLSEHRLLLQHHEGTYDSRRRAKRKHLKAKLLRIPIKIVQSDVLLLFIYITENATSYLQPNP
jgi:hypothetical protein